MIKRGQATIYIIIAVVIVAAVVLVYMFYPNIRSFTSGEINPEDYLRSRIEDPLLQGKEILSNQGGYSDPEGFIQYKGNNVKYLCYNSEYYLPCKVQQPMIKQQFEKELNDLIRDEIEGSLQELKNEYERRGYEVRLGDVETNIEIVPKKINVNINAPLSVTKESSQTYSNFVIEFPSEMYFLLMTATSIIDYEATYGDSETSLYLSYYPNLLIEKNVLGDGSTIYTVEDVTTKERFTFASRSVAWPGGLGLTSEG